MIRGRLADSGGSDGVYRGADGGGYVGAIEARPVTSRLN
mgnify:CR=1 FL=1